MQSDQSFKSLMETRLMLYQVNLHTLIEAANGIPSEIPSDRKNALFKQIDVLEQGIANIKIRLAELANRKWTKAPTPRPASKSLSLNFPQCKKLRVRKRILTPTPGTADTTSSDVNGEPNV